MPKKLEPLYKYALNKIERVKVLETDDFEEVGGRQGKAGLRGAGSLRKPKYDTGAIMTGADS